ncbi:MAG: hypothetical protein ABI411_15830 [Tahibacter sp.]
MNRIQVYQDSDGSWRWAMATDGCPLRGCKFSYPTEALANQAALRLTKGVQALAFDAHGELLSGDSRFAYSDMEH